MEKTTVYLTTEQKAALARIAKAEGRSEARLIRAAVDVVTGGHRAAEAVPALSGLGDRTQPDAGSAARRRPRWIEREEFVRLVARSQADARLRAELRELVPGTTDDEPVR